MKTTLPIHKRPSGELEIFETIQGEGVFTGVPSFFVRLHGCKVRCFFCDEKPTWQHEKTDLYQDMEMEELIDRLKTLNSDLKRVVITGGEPTELDLVPAFKILKQAGYLLAVETAATGEHLSSLLDAQAELDTWLTFSPKEPYSKNGIPADKRIWQLASEVKFVIANQEAKVYLRDKILTELKLAANSCAVYLAPDWHQFEALKHEVLKLCLEKPAKLRFGLQTHKFIGVE
jgi:7-carboxy-7-deazaguanine synthase